MDLRLYLGVLWRFRLLVLAGLVLAFGASLAATMRVEFRDGRPWMTYRDQETWQSGSVLYITQEGFPEGRTSLGESVRVGPDGEPTFASPRFSDPSRYTGLAMIYAQLAKSDAVRRAVFAGGPLSGTYEAEPLRATDGATSLPLVHIRGLAASPELAVAIAHRATRAFRAYLKTEQERSGIPIDQRVHVEIVNRAEAPFLVDGRSIVRPTAVFLLVLMLVLGLAFVLENLRPRPVLFDPSRSVRPADRAPNLERHPLVGSDDVALRRAQASYIDRQRGDSGVSGLDEDPGDAAAGGVKAGG